MKDGSLEHAHPLTLDKLANSHPRLKIVACHFGNPWIEDTAELVYKHENVFADVSGLFAGGGEYASEYLDSLCRKLSEAIYYMGNARKIVFGSDYPVSTPADILKLVSHLRITREDKTKILRANAKELFKL
jgi:predicted TIM-barrel fold metal-dependent hydrolase